MRIRWTSVAAADLQAISEYLKGHHPRYRDPTPTPYVVMYRVREQTVEVLRAYHAAQDQA